MAKQKNNKNNVDREEFGYGYDLSPDDLDVVGQNNAAKAKNQNENDGQPSAKETQSKLNQ